MTLESRYNVLEALLAKTKDEKINWEVGPLSESFYSKIGDNSVAIRQVRDDFHLIIYNADGDVVEEISDPEFSNDGRPGAFNLMKNLFISAKRNALGTDRIVSSILDELEKK
ncbi:hypothetical protein NFO65_18630 [Neorhizobium galegae]|uniref:hypothetical protein n=1 Tax=Neorhizobium galegae TaxID=399 RepID=UPI002100B4D5|nr:hypothetical protein [Neorhizobium galegae]MCQ1572748.1 hypothetical protein [Neorhizobium galegae]